MKNIETYAFYKDNNKRAVRPTAHRQKGARRRRRKKNNSNTENYIGWARVEGSDKKRTDGPKHLQH